LQLKEELSARAVVRLAAATKTRMRALV
ncbi:hypothetical protein EVA_15152, partial [gut metagenome]